MSSLSFSPISWENGTLVLLDQRLLPLKKTFLQITTMEGTISAIRDMAVRGAPAIAITGIFGIALFAKGRSGSASSGEIESVLHSMKQSRPTAVNLTYALAQAGEKVQEVNNWHDIFLVWESFAKELMLNDLRDNEALGRHGVDLFDPNEETFHIITHCNTGALATAGHGTALGVIRSLRDAGKKVIVYADETRPFLQGSRLTAFEMMEEGIECYIITDGMSGWLMGSRKIDAVLVGCDRVARNGDTANKIGTYNLAIVAEAHNVPFYVCATKDSFDLKLETGASIPIEMRKEEEVTRYDFIKDVSGNIFIQPGMTSPVGARALNPSFDVTPAKYIRSFITEFGCFPPFEIPNRLKV
ncbi:S-methyl-5-thioribose-1-phosphate isomerase [Leptospira ognonensis]|uniref:Methylthioribose-1-phosphate isomerase n=1 Tax=Leptospira ognonensis TaxID=2484945 RepID=A0A4R9K253_9LEPT|nr:S-methyl-5-thioribose-1-phosphate isomerase [Leptospira ognonensis]TGL60082.1 S-methyl-5-thioribose-1-phosphate isomerase [Leptospira ognonensis]